MLTEVMAHFGLLKELRQSGYYETTEHKQFFKELKAATQSGSLVALTGVIGCGKTTTLRRLFEVLLKENTIGSLGKSMIVYLSIHFDAHATTFYSLTQY